MVAFRHFTDAIHDFDLAPVLDVWVASSQLTSPLDAQSPQSFVVRALAIVFTTAFLGTDLAPVGSIDRSRDCRDRRLIVALQDALVHRSDLTVAGTRLRLVSLDRPCAAPN